MPRIFVYGTLRKGASAEKLMRSARLIRQNCRLKGYKMYSFGPYPFLIPRQGSSIIGDLFEVDETQIPNLDDYEGKEYSRYFDNNIESYVYVKADNDPEGYPEIPGGDWLFAFL